MAKAKKKRRHFYIENFGDDPCEKCEDQVGKTVAKRNIGIPVKKHPNCKCVVVEDISNTEPDNNEQILENTEDNLEKMADMTTPIQDQMVYRGFVDERFENDEVEYNFDESLVMICPYGDWTGGTADGKIVTQKIDDIALETLAAQTEEVLVDKDHGSMKNVMDRDTRAYGWAKNFIAVTNAGDFSGLYGTIKWSEEGKNLILDRSYRFLSPAFELDKDGRPVKLISIGLTNRPNFKMAPIINSVPDDNNLAITEEIMTKDDVINLIKQVMAEQAEAKEEKEEIIEEAGDKAEEKKAEEINETEEKKEEVENSCETEKKEEKTETENETVEVKEEIKEEVKEEEKKPVKKEKEIIKEEVLNSIPDTAQIEDKPWKNLHGEALQRWMLDNLK